MEIDETLPENVYSGHFEVLIQQNEEILAHLVNIEGGLQVIIYVAIAFLTWAVIKVLYNLLAGVFLGGL